jgi:hypothetical protein
MIGISTVSRLDAYARDISVAFLNTGKSLAPEGFIGFANVTSTISAAFPVRK